MTTEARRRRDVERNHESIVTAAIAVLADEPQATMADIARASGTGRSTLYRHFPDRETLIDAIYQRVLDEAATVGEAAVPRAGTDPIEALIDLVNAFANLGDRYRFLEHNGAHVAVQYPEKAQRIGDVFRQTVTAGRASGGIRTDLSQEWLQALLGAVIKEAAFRLRDAPDRGTTIRATVTSLFAPTGPQ